MGTIKGGYFTGNSRIIFDYLNPRGTEYTERKTEGISAYYYQIYFLAGN